MTATTLSRVLGMALLSGSALIAMPALANTCADLAKLAAPDATITAATVESGAFQSPKDGLGVTTKVTAPFCRVEGIAKSEAASRIRFELWLPPADKWNGRLLASGDLGQSGAPNYPALNDALTRGFAALGDNLGHDSNAFSSDWAIGHPERVEDWGYRASHYSAVAAKAIVAAYYGKGPNHSYFSGCSHGGGSALAEAQRYPGITTASSPAPSAPTGPACRAPMSTRPGGAERQGEQPFRRQAGAGRQGRRRRLRCAGRRQGRHHRQSRSVPLRSGGPALQGRRRRRLPHRAAGRGGEEALCRPHQQRRPAHLRRAGAGQRVPVGLPGGRPADLPRRRLLQGHRLRRKTGTGTASVSTATSPSP